MNRYTVNRQGIPREKIVWNKAHFSVPDYQSLYNYVVARAGDGELVTNAQLGISHNFTFREAFQLITESGSFVIYSMDSQTGEIDVELID